ncbi:MAG: glycoside hydrolase family 9 protein [Ignavibacteriales bacterium]|nr:glycoside hydrolase family 9 protein [Ignavibacteriales bacterium]
MMPIWRILIFLGSTFNLLTGQQGERAERILLNQAGYRPGDRKIAFIRTVPGDEFEVMNLATNKPILNGKVGALGINDRNTGDSMHEIDFSSLKSPGRYQLRIRETSMVSPEFVVAADVYDVATLASIESFYYQRCGTEMDNGTPWRHPPCHTADAVFFDKPSEHMDVTGGWHDAGDYGKFVATAAVSAACLLSLHELHPSKFVDGQLSIPEAGNRIPDLLDEVRWELEWLLKMQRRDGGVHHKVSTKKWTGEYLPDRDPDQRYIFGVSSAATGAFAAVMAQAARIYDHFDPPFAQRLLRSSIHAWKFLEANPSIVPSGGFRNPPGVEGGEYGDTKDEDERLWGAAELYRTTGSLEYHRYFLTRFKQLGGMTYTVSWQNVQNFAYYSYMMGPREALDNDARAFIVATLTRYADRLLGRIEENGYRHVLGAEEYYWGSNSVALGYALDLIQAFRILGSARYREGALDQLHYILGRNPFDQTFITGVGDRPVKHPYHQFSMMLRAGSPVPGLIVGGANKNGRLRGKVLSGFPGKCYEDNGKNYYVNEVAINYTAPFTYVAGFFSSLAEGKERVGSIGGR